MITNLQERFLTNEQGNCIVAVLAIAIYEKLLEDLGDVLNLTNLNCITILLKVL